MRVVMKFGGTSMASVETIRHCAGLVKDAASSHEVVAVVSAMSGVTDQLVELAATSGGGDRSSAYALLGAIRTRHESAAEELGVRPVVDGLLDELGTLVEGIIAVGELTARSKDALVSFGERLSSSLMAAAMGGRAITGGEAGIITDDNFGDAHPLMELSRFQIRERLLPGMEAGELVVVTGFLAQTQHGASSTLGRGGSDNTATILGAALDADEIWIWSDVDGLMSADPRVVPGARLLRSVTFSEAIEMGQFGAKSMHPRALEPAAEAGIPVRMRNTFKPEVEGTRISAAEPQGDAVHCVLSLKGSTLITVSGAAMIGRPGTAAKLFTALADASVNVRMISQTVSESEICVLVSGSQSTLARAVLERELLRSGVARAIRADEDVAVVAAVGAGMHKVTGVAAKVFGAVSEIGVNVIAITQGSSELSISFVVPGDGREEAVRAVHRGFGLG